MGGRSPPGGTGGESAPGGPASVIPDWAPSAAQQRRARCRLAKAERKGRTEAGGGSSLAGVGRAPEPPPIVPCSKAALSVCGGPGVRSAPLPRALTGDPEGQGGWHPEPPARAPGAGLEGLGARRGAGRRGGRRSRARGARRRGTPGWGLPWDPAGTSRPGRLLDGPGCGLLRRPRRVTLARSPRGAEARKWREASAGRAPRTSQSPGKSPCSRDLRLGLPSSVLVAAFQCLHVTKERTRGGAAPEAGGTEMSLGVSAEGRPQPRKAPRGLEAEEERQFPEEMIVVVVQEPNVGSNQTWGDGR